MSKRPRYDVKESTKPKKKQQNKATMRAATKRPETNKNFDLENVILCPSGDAAVSPSPYNSGTNLETGNVQIPIYATCINSGIAWGGGAATSQGRAKDTVYNSAVAIKGQVVVPETIDDKQPIAYSIALYYVREIPESISALYGSDFFVTDASRAGNVPKPGALSDLTNVAKFKLLKEWRYVFNNEGFTAGTDRTIIFDEYIQLKNRVTQWKRGATAGLFDEMVKGALILVVGGNQMHSSGSVAWTACDKTQTPLFNFSSRIYYHE